MGYAWRKFHEAVNTLDAKSIPSARERLTHAAYACTVPQESQIPVELAARYKDLNDRLTTHARIDLSVEAMAEEEVASVMAEIRAIEILLDRDD